MTGLVVIPEDAHTVQVADENTFLFMHDKHHVTKPRKYKIYFNKIIFRQRTGPI
jgi:hypothetical protein